MADLRLRQTTLGFLVAVLALILICIFSVWSTVRSRQYIQRAISLDQVLRVNEELFRDSADLQSNGRGYVITRDAMYLNRFEDSAARASEDVNRLRALVSDKAQIERVAEIRSLLDRRVEWSREMIRRLNTSGFKSAAEMVSQGTGTKLLDDLRAKAFELEQVEENALHDARAKSLSLSSFSLYSMIIGGIIALFVASLVVVMLSTETGALQKLQHQLKSSERRLNEIISNTTQSVVVRGLDGKIQMVNQRAIEVMGHSRDELIGKEIENFYGPEVAENSRKQFDAVIASGMPVEYLSEVPMGSKTATFQVVQFPIRDADGRLVSVGIMGTEITDIMAAQRAAESARSEAEAAREAAERAMSQAEHANAAKSQFLSRISHELRTPMNAILGFAQLLEMQHLEEKQREAVTQILNAGKHLLNLINDVLDISRIEAGEIALSIEPVDAGEVVSEAINLVAPIAEKFGIVLINECSPGGLYVRSDRQRLRQVLMNLLSNASKYNVAGGKAWARCREHEKEVCIEIVDTGKGIPPAQLDQLFAPFERLGAEAHMIEGTGLGLSLSRRLIEAMGGTLTYASNENGVGSTFTIQLPRASASEMSRSASREFNNAKVSAADATGKTVLYIEDNVANFKLVEQLLESRPNTRMIAAIQGRMGLDLAREHKPDVILLDIHLPDIDGAKVLTELKLQEELKKIPVIIVSADVTERQIERLMGLGAFAYVAKPFQLAELLSRIDEALAAGG
jgi:PAS domain S-box-containing protein